MDESTRDLRARIAAVMAALVAEKFIPPAMPVERRELLIATLVAGLGLDTHEPVSQARNVSIDEIYADPAASFWLRECLASAITRDPIDAANDAEILARSLAHRAKALLAGEPHSVHGDE